MDNKIKPGFGDEITLPEWTTLSIRNKELYETAIAEGGNPAHLNKKNLAEAYLADKFIQNQKDAKESKKSEFGADWHPGVFLVLFLGFYCWTYQQGNFSVPDRFTATVGTITAALGVKCVQTIRFGSTTSTLVKFYY